MNYKNNYSKWEVKKANEIDSQIKNFNVTPHVIRAFSVLWDTIDRFACMSIKDVQNSVSTQGEIPYKLKNWVIEIISKNGNTNTFFSPHFKMGENFNIFVKECIRRKINPAEYIFAGAIIIQYKKQTEFVFEG